MGTVQINYSIMEHITMLTLASQFQPTVSVIIAAYNAEATIARAIQSALVEPEVDDKKMAEKARYT
jgi:hypothetical protein